MAIYHCSIKIISRGKGKSAVAAAAYRAGEKITNEYDGIVHDYTRKSGVVHTEILLHENAPSEYSERDILWNAVEKIEKAKNSQLAREIELALPKELTREQNISLVRKYVTEHFVAHGMCADVAIHDTKSGNVNEYERQFICSSTRLRSNPHAHILLTMRPFESDKSWGAKQKKEYILDKNGEKIYDPKKRQYKCKSVPTTDWNEQTKAEEWRAAWASSVNAFLERQDIDERVDHRSYERQNIEKIPSIHLGVAASQMERKGIQTERGNLNREITKMNKIIRGIAEQISKLKERLRGAFTPAVHRNSTEKPSIKAQLEKYKQQAKDTEQTTEEPCALEKAVYNLDAVRVKIKELDVRIKRAVGDDEWRELVMERRRAYREYSRLKMEVKRAQKSHGLNHPQTRKKSRDRGVER